MTPNGEGSEGCKAKSKGRRWYYLAVKTLLALLRGINSKYYGDFWLTHS